MHGTGVKNNREIFCFQPIQLPMCLNCKDLILSYSQNLSRNINSCKREWESGQVRNVGL